ncbi:AraC family transcriptional regulator [Fusobacterium necrophorum]|uniref:Transcriptional regulator n=2 Tax=Fusobacterium necrophorum TaxID=859 RepID=A0A017H641_9FUSO|nr:AraC family transcriptional regulator [Fusobacterium necrophorum]EYD69578.1 transcriptional regulatory protein [Fusobacterium necrophorum subsp. funduliforme B35]KDE64173.1 transcriptional regulator [Fusobacterium necrophorum BFTR-1]KDE67595.1 transcriptional regulator [Fusobacterium necrophorum DJ-1]KDE72017.1 transcriptional regulator [Fusobacterium necrophorum DJ-2]KID48685.1 transcriptional regulator [Fusobacterium necrophorum subsp. funduliforme B35]
MRREDFIEMYFQRLSNIENLTEIADLFGNRYVFPNSHGKYWFYRVSLEEGMDITFTSLPNRLNYSFESENWQEEVLELGVCTEGSMEILCYPSLEKYSYQKGQACLYYSKNTVERFEFSVKNCKSFSIHLHLDYFESFFKLGKHSWLEQEWRKNIKHMLQEKILRVWNSSIYLQALAAEITDFKIKSILDYFDFKGKINYFLAKLMLEAIGIVDNEDEKIQHLKFLVSRDYEKVYSLPEISKFLGTPIFRLQTMMKEKKGMTVSQYIRDVKMEYAKILLEKNTYTVAEVAAMIGYSNPSKFSKNFFQKYQKNPKEFKHSKIYEKKDFKK